MPTTPAPRRWTGPRRVLAALAVAMTVLAVAGCSTPAPDQPDLSAALVTSGLNKKVADCTAKALTRSLTSSELAELTERGAGGAPVDDPKKSDESADKLTKAMAACRELLVTTGPTTTTSVPIPIDTEDGPLTDGAELNPASTTSTTP